MSEITIEGYDRVNNVSIYGLSESIRGAKFPMSTNVNNLNSDLTKGIKSLAMSGTGEGHDQWLTGIIVQFDLTFSNKAWVELERYHFFDFVSSCSTMHRIAKMDMDKVYNEYVDDRIINIMKEKVKEYNDILDEDIEKKKEKYLEVLYNNPAGCLITARMTTNYRQLKTVYKQRKDHRLPEWREFCKWLETLPYSEFITGKVKEEE